MYGGRWTTRQAAAPAALLAARLAALPPALAFALPAVALALLAHLPSAHAGAPSPARVLLAAALLVALCAGADLIRSARLRRRRLAGAARPVPRPPDGGRRIGGPRSFAGLFLVQAGLHVALLTAPASAPAGNALAARLLCAPGPDGGNRVAPADLLATALAGGRGGTSSRPVDSLPSAGHGSWADGLPWTGRGSGSWTDFVLGGILGVGGVGGVGGGVGSATEASVAGPFAVLAQGHGGGVLATHAAAAAALWWPRRGCGALVAALALLGSRLRLSAPPTLVPIIRPIVRRVRTNPRKILDRPWNATASRGPPAARGAVPTALARFGAPA